MSQKRTLEEHMTLPYRIALTHDDVGKGHAGYFGEVEELPRCRSQGNTLEDAVESIRDAMQDWLSVYSGS